jgi:glycosyltransferase involved in cell wall biosynthesis
MGGVSPNAMESTAMKINKYFKDIDDYTVVFDDESSEVSNTFNSYNIDHSFTGNSLQNKLLSILLELNRTSYDIIHFYGFSTRNVLILGTLSRLLNIPIVTRFNGYNNSSTPWKNKISSNIEKSYIENSTKSIFISKGQREDILNKYNIKKNHHAVVPPGIPSNWFNLVDRNEISALRSSLSIDKNSKIIGSVLTPRPVKNMKGSIDIIKHLNKKYNITYVVVGESNYLSKYINYANSLGINNNIRWAGHIDSKNLSKYYSLFDVCILTSHFEGFGQSISESYLCQTPCVVSDVGGLRNQVKHAETGYLSDPDNQTEFANFIGELLENESKKKRFGSTGKKHIQNNYILDKTGEKYNSILFDVEKQIN